MLSFLTLISPIASAEQRDNQLCGKAFENSVSIQV